MSPFLRERVLLVSNYLPCPKNKAFSNHQVLQTRRFQTVPYTKRLVQSVSRTGDFFRGWCPRKDLVGILIDLFLREFCLLLLLVSNYHLHETRRFQIATFSQRGDFWRTWRSQSVPSTKQGVSKLSRPRNKAFSDLIGRALGLSLRELCLLLLLLVPRARHVVCHLGGDWLF